MNQLAKTVLFFILFLRATSIYCQVPGVGINDDNSNPDSSAMLDVQSTKRGMLIPRMSTAQRNLITSPATGLLVFDINDNSFWFYNGSAWTKIGGVTVDATLTGAGTAASPLGLAQNSASNLDILTWNGNSWAPAPGLWFPNGSNIAYTTRNVGIGLNNPGRELVVKGDIVAEENTLLDKGGLLMTDIAGVPRVYFNHQYTPDETQFRVEVYVPNTSGTARVEFFRNTEASVKRVEFFRGGTFGTARSAVIGVDAEDSYFQIHGGNMGIGTDVPTKKLHVVGDVLVEGDIMVTGSVASNTELVVFEESLSGGGGAATLGLNKRQINAISSATAGSSNMVLDDINNTITLQPGQYYVTASAPASNVGYHRLFIYEVAQPTDNVQLLGTNEISTASDISTSSTISGLIQVSAVPKTIKLEHWVQSSNGNTNALGLHITGLSGFNNTYARITIQKIN